MQINRPSISSIYKDLNMKDFLTRTLIAYPTIMPTIEEVDRIMKEFAHKLCGEQRLEFEDNCLERIDELLQEEKNDQFHKEYDYEKHCVMNTGYQLNMVAKK